MKPATVRAALFVPGLPPQTSRLLAYMADAADDDNRTFFRSRARMVHEMGIHEDTIKTAIRNLIKLGYLSEVQRARTGKNTRILRLHPEAWPQPAPWQRVHGDATTPDPEVRSPDHPTRAETGVARAVDAALMPTPPVSSGSSELANRLSPVSARVLQLRKEAYGGRHH